MASVAESAAMIALEEFEANARAVAATVERVERSSAAIAAAVARAAPQARSIAVAEPLDLPAELFAGCRALPGVVTERSRAAMNALDVGITDAFAAVASTGSVCVTVDRGHAGAISLLARTHIAVVDSAAIVARPGDLMRPDRAGGAGLRRNFVYVTGPSATADMGPLVRGVHGPHRLHILVLL